MTHNNFIIKKSSTSFEKRFDIFSNFREIVITDTLNK